MPKGRSHADRFEVARPQGVLCGRSHAVNDAQGDSPTPRLGHILSQSVVGGSRHHWGTTRDR